MQLQPGLAEVEKTEYEKVVDIARGRKLNQYLQEDEANLFLNTKFLNKD